MIMVLLTGDDDFFFRRSRLAKVSEIYDTSYITAKEMKEMKKMKEKTC